MSCYFPIHQFHKRNYYLKYAIILSSHSKNQTNSNQQINHHINKLTMWHYGQISTTFSSTTDIILSKGILCFKMVTMLWVLARVVNFCVLWRKNAHKEWKHSSVLVVNIKVSQFWCTVWTVKLRHSLSFYQYCHAMGFSQSGQFLRAVAQKCLQGMKTIVSFGGQHQGHLVLMYHVDCKTLTFFIILLILWTWRPG